MIIFFENSLKINLSSKNYNDGSEVALIYEIQFGSVIINFRTKIDFYWIFKESNLDYAYVPFSVRRHILMIKEKWKESKLGKKGKDESICVWGYVI